MTENVVASRLVLRSPELPASSRNRWDVDDWIDALGLCGMAFAVTWHVLLIRTCVIVAQVYGNDWRSYPEVCQ